MIWDWAPILLSVIACALIVRRLLKIGGSESDLPRHQLGLIALVLTTLAACSVGAPIPSWSAVAGLLVVLWASYRLAAVSERIILIKSRLTVISSQLETTSENASSAIATSQRRFKELARIAPVGIFELDRMANFVFVSQRWCDLTGMKARDAARSTFLEPVHPDDKAEIERALLRAMSKVERFEEAMRFRHPDGREVWAAVVAVPILDEADSTVRYVGTGLDLSDSREREQERLRLKERIERAERLEGLGKIAGGMAHELNNVLVPVLGNADRLLRSMNGGSPLSPQLAMAEHIREAALRASELVARMLMYAGAGHGAHERIDLTTVYADIRRNLEQAARDRARFEAELDEEELPVRGDPIRIARAFQVLFEHGLESIPDETGRIVVRLGLTALGPREIEELIIGDDMRPGAYGLFEVADEGSTLDRETALKLFDPLGQHGVADSELDLLQVAGLVRIMKGGLGLRRNGPRGKVLSIYLPLDDGRKAAPREEDRVRTKLPGPLLIIDDDPAVRTTMRLTLEDFGHEVIEAEDGHRGIEIVSKRRAEIAAILLDLSMPTMSGEEVHAWLEVHAPELPVLFLSGYGERELILRLTTGPMRTAFLRKPFVSQELEETLLKLLGGDEIKP